MPIIHIQMLEGRTLAQKRALVRAMTEGFTRICGGDAGEVNIVITEVGMENWGSGGVLCCDAAPLPPSVDWPKNGEEC